MTSSLSTVCYIGATILFILCLGGLSGQETSRRGNLYGMIGMAIAVLATVFGVQVMPSGLPDILAAMACGAAISTAFRPACRAHALVPDSGRVMPVAAQLAQPPIPRPL